VIEPWQANALTMPSTIYLSLSDIVSVTIRLALVHSKGPQGMVGCPFPCLGRRCRTNTTPIAATNPDHKRCCMYRQLG
jgi:hypothetical protein